MRIKMAIASALAVCAMLLCPGCNEAEVGQLIKDGSEAGAVAALGILATSPAAPESALIKAAAVNVCNEALKVLQDDSSATTLQQVLDLTFSSEPELANIQQIVNYIEPVLLDIPGVKAALNDPMTSLLPEINTYAQDFFTGILIGLGDAPGTTVAQLMAKNPKLAQAAKKLGMGKFDPANIHFAPIAKAEVVK